MPRSRQPRSMCITRGAVAPVRELENRIADLKQAVPTWTALIASFERDLEVARAQSAQPKP